MISYVCVARLAFVPRILKMSRCLKRWPLRIVWVSETTPSETNSSIPNPKLSEPSGFSEMREPGVYVSFAENRQAFLRNMRRTHLDFEKLEGDRLFKFVDLITVREGIEESLTNIMREITGLKAQRLVIDSFSAMAQALPNKIDARIVMHTVLGKMTRFTGVGSAFV